ncbi:RNA polymerase sigma-70 factor, ECF subfamily [Paracoccus saliphilus]|uniref:RNA polymerase sigma-70 factor, ECF subfamily n=3 Tax=Paracoccus saliphilus TaxID=405559 RepID=A0AA46A4W4_9RHOB|nr:sigma-70 family RNA polymerase sigma factor [Paracoccus saliphilus]SIS70635.1 RNA polymerase sigma-70 factor, ECF subfamily [Paracoccus saliphilus]
MTHQIATKLRFLERCPAKPARNKAAHANPREDIVKQLRSMRAFARSLTGDRARADDLVLDTVVTAWATIDRLEPGSNMRTWLFTILRNSFYSEFREAAGETVVENGIRGKRMAIEPDHDGIFEPASFRRAFNTLPAEQREALVLVGAAGFSYDEAAAMCGCATITIENRRKRGQRSLAAVLSLEQDDAVRQGLIRSRL